MAPLGPLSHFLPLSVPAEAMLGVPLQRDLSYEEIKLEFVMIGNQQVITKIDYQEIQKHE